MAVRILKDTKMAIILYTLLIEHSLTMRSKIKIFKNLRNTHRSVHSMHIYIYTTSNEKTDKKIINPGFVQEKPPLFVDSLSCYVQRFKRASC